MTNRQLGYLLEKFARTFGFRWLPHGDQKLMDGFPPGTVIDPMRGAEVGVLYITKNGRGVGLMAADSGRGEWRRVTPESVDRAIRNRKGNFCNGKWVS